MPLIFVPQRLAVLPLVILLATLPARLEGSALQGLICEEKDSFCMDQCQESLGMELHLITRGMGANSQSGEPPQSSESQIDKSGNREHICLPKSERCEIHKYNEFATDCDCCSSLKGLIGESRCFPSLFCDLEYQKSYERTRNRMNNRLSKIHCQYGFQCQSLKCG